MYILPVESVSLSERTVIISTDGQCVDSFCGVDSLYILGAGNSNTNEYSCASYVKKFYATVADLYVYNLNFGCTPLEASGETFEIVDTPLVGDIGYQISNSGNCHWFIVKTVESSAVTVIEQNWKWVNSSGNTCCIVDRRISTENGVTFFRPASGSILESHADNPSLITNFAVSMVTTDGFYVSASASDSDGIDSLLFSVQASDGTSFTTAPESINGKYESYFSAVPNCKDYSITCAVTDSYGVVTQQTIGFTLFKPTFLIEEPNGLFQYRRLPLKGWILDELGIYFITYSIDNNEAQIMKQVTRNDVESMFGIPTYGFEADCDITGLSVGTHSIVITAFLADNVEYELFNSSFTISREYIAGDVNDDGFLNVLDACLIARYLADFRRIGDESFITDEADYNKDGSIDILDCLAICRKVIG